MIPQDEQVADTGLRIGRHRRNVVRIAVERRGPHRRLLVGRPERSQVDTALRHQALQHVQIPGQRDLARAIVCDSQLPRGRRIQVQVHALDRNQAVAGGLDDQDVLHADRAGVLRGLVASDDRAMPVQQNRAPSPVATERISDHGIAAQRALVRVPGIRREV